MNLSPDITTVSIDDQDEIVMSGSLTFTVTFNREMNISIDPTISFGTSAPYERHTVSGSWSDDIKVWAGTYYIDDPNNVNVNYNMVNGERNHQLYGAPPYEDMFIYAELTAVRKARTVLVTTEGVTAVDDNGMNETIKVNFMGNDQNQGTTTSPNPNYLNFTTNYYDGSTGEDLIFESFGMTAIKVQINSSFIPQINIQFVDIRGLAFFNQKDSPYRVLFDFPPPIFNLKIKGYYGKTLSYQLHLVKYTSEFKSENGNFIIDAQFVAMTYAPLSDVLFRYIINFPLINKGRSGNPS